MPEEITLPNPNGKLIRVGPYLRYEVDEYDLMS